MYFFPFFSKNKGFFLVPFCRLFALLYTGCKRYCRPFFEVYKNYCRKSLKNDSVMKLCIFVPFHINLTFSRKNNPQQRRPPPASTWTSCRPFWSPPWGGWWTPPRWRWSGAASCCGVPVNISLRNATQKIVLSITIKWTRRPDLFKTTVSWIAPCLHWLAPE